MIDPVITAWACDVAEADHPPSALPPRLATRARRMDRLSLRAVSVASRALLASDVTGADLDGLGVFFGTSLGCAEVNEAYHRGLVEQGVGSPALFAQTIPSGPVGEIAIVCGARGHATTVMAGRCSGLAALAEARRALRLGRCRHALVVAGDVVGPDRASILSRGGAASFAEATVALLLTRPDLAGSALAILREVSIACASPTAPSEGGGSLGASGLVEAARWLGGGTGEFTIDIECPSGLRGGLRIERVESDGHRGLNPEGQTD